MVDIIPLTVFTAIQNKIKTLCLRDFPCGTGSWHKVDHLPKNIRRKSGSEAEETYENLQMDIVEAEKENSDLLVELITDPHSPWYMDYSWSQEAHSLKETAIKSPWLIKPDFVYSYFRTLKIDDSFVTEIDKGLLRFKNLEEITLCANYIKTVNSSCLPASLKVLELYANDIDDITGLCNRPPPLCHLGLGRNQISDVGNCISGAFWPELVSLDLSYNNLCGLREIVNILSTLPKLKNLILQGNPVSLIAGYRGYVIDTLQNLTILDDKQISVDEKYSFAGLATLEDLVREEVTVQLGVISLKGLQCPPEIRSADSQPDYHTIERTYFVQFMLPGMYEEPAEKTEAQIAYLCTDLQSISEGKSLGDLHKSLLEKGLLKLTFSAGLPPDDVEHTQSEKNLLEENVCKEKHESVVDDTRKMETSADVPQTAEVRTVIQPVNSCFLPWEDQIQFNWTRDITLKDLLTVRDFFQTGMDVNVMEQTVEAYPSGDIMGVSKRMEPKGKEQKDKTDKKKNKEPKKAEDRAKKMQGSSDEFIKNPPKLKNIASFHVPLDSFLNGELEYKNTFTKTNISSQTSIQSKISEEKIDKKCDKRSGSLKSPSIKKDHKKSPLAKEVGKRKHGYNSDEISPPAELQLVVTVKLGHWTTAMDAVTVVNTATSGETV